MNDPHPAAVEALDRLRLGNRRFISNQSEPARFRKVEEQQPFAVVLGCSDSRVPAEIVFDQGIGDLFVVRVAGHVVAPSVVGSIEFAVAKCGARLVVVLGHTHCGAVLATINTFRDPAPEESPNLRALVEQIGPAIDDLLGTAEAAPEGSPQRGELVRQAVRANVRASVKKLSRASDELKHYVRDEGLVIVGAEYSLESGEVDFFDGLLSDM